MNEHEELRASLKEPERFCLELPLGHPGQRPFSVFEAVSEELQKDLRAVSPTISKVRAGDPLNTAEVGSLLSQLVAIRAKCVVALQALDPICSGLSVTFTPPTNN